MDWRERIRTIPDFPKPGINFRDITPVLGDPAAFAGAVDELARAADGLAWERLVALEARGFLFGAPLAIRAGKGLVPLRKPGKLPAAVERVAYDLEYGTAELEMHRDAVAAGERILVVDDLLATGGTAAAAGELVRRAGGAVSGYLFLVELAGLDGRARLTDAPVISLVTLPA